MKKLLLLAVIVTAAAAKTVKLDFWKYKQVPQSTLSRRSDDFASPVSGDYHRIEYFINVTIGTPGQPFALQLDTGSSDTWVPSADAETCEDDGCIDYGAFNKNVSSTYSVVPDQVGTFYISYADGTSATGDYFTDVLSFGGNISITNTTMANANDTFSIDQGLMGIGLRSNEAGLQNDDPFSFPTVPEQLKAQGFIDRNAYSLYLDSYDDNTGSILFGGIDPSKHVGDLLALPLSTDVDGNYTEFRVALTKISIHDGKSTRALTGPTFSVPALLDSGTTLSYLPINVVEPLNDGLGATLDENSGLSYVPCTYRQSNVSLIYTFGGVDGVNVSVPLSELISGPIDDDSAYSDGTPGCSLNFADGDGDVVLGDSFLRSAYVVYDLENFVVALGQAKLDGKAATDTAEATAIPSGTSLPGVTRTATITASMATTTGPYSAYLGNVGTPTFSLPGVAITPTVTGKALEEKNGAGGIEITMMLGVVPLVMYALW